MERPPAPRPALPSTLGRLGRVAALLLLSGCARQWQEWRLAANRRDIERATAAIAVARTDVERARATSDRGAAYSERARYSRVFKLISPEECARLFGLAVADHDRAVALAPGDAGVYLQRGLAYYNRAALEERADPSCARHFAAARDDFTRAVERDPDNEQALDMRGLVFTSLEDHDGAIRDFTAVMRLDPRLGRLRLAEEYCTRGGVNVRAKRYDLAIADYERSISMNAPSDGCSCQPDSPLAWTYLETGQVEKSWATVRRAQRAHRWIMPELLERLRNVSGRNG